MFSGGVAARRVTIMPSAPSVAPQSLVRLARWAASENYLVLLVCTAATLMLLGVGAFVMSDTWLALVAGRVVADGGPPSTDSLTAWTLGRDWVDQQWLGQLVLYEIWRVGGLVLVGLAHVTVVITTFVMTLTGARRRGGLSRHVAVVALLALLPIGIVAGNIRTQTFAFALFVLVLWLLSEDSRTPSRRVLWCVPLLVLWANLHGSVLVGGALMLLAGAIALFSGARSAQRAQMARGAVLMSAVPLALMGTPYGFSLFGYFGDLFGNSEIGRIAPEWMPTAFAPVHVPFYVLAGLTVALIGRDRGRLTAFEQITVVGLLVGALVAERNLAWFALAAVLFLPAMLTSRRPDRGGQPPPVGLAAPVAAVAALAVLVAAVAGLSGVEQQVNSRYPASAAAVVVRETDRDPRLKLFIHARYADWLLFRYPRLAGRVPFDIRFELLTPAELRRFRRVLHQIGADWRGAAGDARLFVLDSSEKPLGVLAPTSAVLQRERGARQLYARHDVAVVLGPPPTAPNP